MAVATRPASASTRPTTFDPARRRRFAILAPTLLVVMAAALRFYAINSQSLWYDEGVSAGMVGQGAVTIIREAAADFHPPLYYMLLAAWSRLFGDSTIALRGLSACAGVLLVFLTWRIASLLFGRRVGWLAGIWSTVAPLGIAFSQELRMYMPVAACVALAAYCAVRWLEVGRDCRAPCAGTDRTQQVSNGTPVRKTGEMAAEYFLVGYTLAAAVALYLQYVAALGLAAVGLYGLLRARGRSLSQWLGANVVALLLFAPWVPVFHHQLSAGRTATTAHTSAGYVISAAFGSLLVGVDGLPLWNRAAVVLLGVLVALGVWRIRWDGERGVLPLLLVALPLLGVTAYAAWKSVYEVRYILVALPGVAMLGSLGVAQIGDMTGFLTHRWVQTRALSLGVALLAASVAVAAAGAADVRYYVAPVHPHDNYRGLAATITREAEPGDAVLLYPPGQNHVFDYYYRGTDSVVSLPLQRPPNAADVTARLAALFQAHPRVWVVEYGATEADPSGVVSSWLAGHAFLASHQWFGSPQLLLYAASDGSGRTTTADVGFANGAELLSYAVSSRVIAPGGTVEITLNWRDDRPVAQRYTVFTHILDGRNQVVAQHDGEPAGGSRPTTTWQPGEVITDRHGIVLPSHLPTGVYTIEVGMYLPTAGVRTTIISADQFGADRLLLGPVSVAAVGAR